MDVSTDTNKLKLINLSDEVQQAMAGTTPIIAGIADGGVGTTKYADNSITYAKIKFPEAYIMTKDAITLNLQTNLITFVSSFYLFVDNAPILISNHLSIDITGYGTGIRVCYYDFSDSKIKCVKFDAVPDIKKVILFNFNNDHVMTKNRKSIIARGTTGSLISLVGNSNINTNDYADASIINSKYSDNFISAYKSRFPEGYIMTKDVITLNLQTNLITFATSFYLYTDNVVKTVSNHVPISFTPAGLMICYYDLGDSTIKCVKFDVVPDTAKIIIFAFNGDYIMSKNRQSIILYNTLGKLVTTSSTVIKNGYITTENLIIIDDSVKTITVSGANLGTGFFVGSVFKGIANQVLNYSSLPLNKAYVIYYDYTDLALKCIEANGSIPTDATILSYFYTGVVYMNNLGVKMSTELLTPPVVVTSDYDKIINRLLLPPKMFFIGNLPVYKESILASAISEEKFKTALIDFATDATPHYKYFYEDVTLNTSELASVFQFGVKQKANLSYDYISPTITKTYINPSTKNGVTFNSLMIGDSITQAGLTALRKTKLTGLGVTMNTIGTTLINGSRCEARGGWGWDNYIGIDNTKNTGGTLVPNPTSPDTTAFENPFLKLATETDKTNHPDWCFRNTGIETELSYTQDVVKVGDFYIFDFAVYLSNHGYANPDLITIALGTNDYVDNGSTRGLVTAKLGLEIIIKQIKSAVPNCKIGIIPSPAWGNNEYGQDMFSDVATWIETCMVDVKIYQQTYTGLDIVPIWCHMDRTWSFTYDVTTDLSSINTTSERYKSDIYHPRTQGQCEYINALSAYVINVI